MKIIHDEACTGYMKPGHPERPVRITRTVELLRKQTELPVTWIAPAAGDHETDILRAHTPGMLARLEQPVEFDNDTPWYPNIGVRARASVAAGFVSGGSRRNLDWVRPHLDIGPGVSEDELLLLADAQTSGGLLIAGEVPGAPVIGRLVPRGDSVIVIR